VTRNRVAFAGAAAVLTAAALLLGGAFRGSSAAAPAAPSGAETRFEAGFALGDTASLVRNLQVELRAHPNAHAYGLLGLAYQQRARETGDPSYYTKSDQALHAALRSSPDDLVATAGLASLALSRHRFRDALSLARRTQAISPSTARTYGLLGDAELELGRYRAAFSDFDRLARLKPSLASYARVSYARELLGHRAEAIAAMGEAVDAATDEAEPTAWTHVQLGKLYWASGHLAPATRQYRLALAAFPGYVNALDALAQVESARGRLAPAIALERRAADRIPLPQFVAALGDLYRADGRQHAAAREYALIGAIERLLAANGVKTDLETALFDVDHGVDLPRALARARLARRERPSIDGDDVLAWALARNGRCAEALPYSKRALRLGTLDALKFFHRGEIERCLGRRTDARRWFHRALALNPHFSLLWAPVAREALR